MTETTATKTRKPAPAAKATADAETAPATGDLAALLVPKKYETTSSVPQEVAQMVENAFKAWQGGDKAWLVVSLSSADAVERVFKQARRYCFERETRLTFQRRRTENGTELVFRCRDKIAQKRSK
ncbi:hypothetical protein ABZX95_06125 [Streptomyces sp. NPDC004232]|uniref:hypothetical protein n=1 Tax=Streptomyces sp. NPDC004232 TaxID=3154454 RepID=UPI0033B57888